MPGFAPFPPPVKHAKRWKLYLLGSIAMNSGLVLGLVLFGGLLMHTIVDDVGQYLASRRAKSWTNVTGRITNSGTTREGKGKLGVVANYAYVVNGQEYAGTRLVFSARRPVVGSEAEADALLAPFGRFVQDKEFSEIFDAVRPRTGPSVTVYYDPSAPQNSTLRQEYMPSPDLWVIWPVIPISAFVIVILIWSIRSWVRYVRRKEYLNVRTTRLLE